MVYAIPVLWRLHRVHHADPDYDLTTGARFYPFEIVLSMQVKLVPIQKHQFSASSGDFFRWS